MFMDSHLISDRQRIVRVAWPIQERQVVPVDCRVCIRNIVKPGFYRVRGFNVFFANIRPKTIGEVIINVHDITEREMVGKYSNPAVLFQPFEQTSDPTY
jgi:hypothetical protein